MSILETTNTRDAKYQLDPAKISHYFSYSTSFIHGNFFLSKGGLLIPIIRWLEEKSQSQPSLHFLIKSRTRTAGNNFIYSKRRHAVF